jgi:Flp pilus assembly protein TadD
MSDRELREDIARNLGLLREQAEAYYRRALQAFDEGDMENAILDISEALYNDAGYAEFYATRGLFYLQDLKLAEADADLHYALKLNKRTWLAHYCLGIVDFQAADYQAAFAHFNTAAQYAPHRFEVIFYRGVAAWYANKDDIARQDMEEAYKLLPEDDKRRKEAQAWLKEFGVKLPAEAKPEKLDAPKEDKAVAASSAKSLKDGKDSKDRKKTGEAKQITSGKKR